MSKTPYRKFRYSKTNIFIVVISLFILAGSLTLWWIKIFKDPQNVFEAMLNNNLTTTSVTRQGAQESENGALNQQTQLSNAAKTGIHSLTSVRQSTGFGDNYVITETIATPHTDFVRYNHVETPQKNESGQDLDFSSILGVWATQDKANQGQFFSEGALNVFMFGNLPAPARNDLVNQMKEAYKVDYANVREAKQGGRVRYIYDVTVEPEKFVSIFKNYAKAMNLTSFNGLDTSNFEDSEPMKLTVTVDLLSRQLVGVLYKSNQTAETYNGHGLIKPIVEPKDAVTIEEIQKRLSNIQ